MIRTSFDRYDYNDRHNKLEIYNKRVHEIKNKIYAKYRYTWKTGPTGSDADIVTKCSELSILIKNAIVINDKILKLLNSDKNINFNGNSSFNAMISSLDDAFIVVEDYFVYLELSI